MYLQVFLVSIFIDNFLSWTASCKSQINSTSISRTLEKVRLIGTSLYPRVLSDDWKTQRTKNWAKRSGVGKQSWRVDELSRGDWLLWTTRSATRPPSRRTARSRHAQLADAHSTPSPTTTRSYRGTAESSSALPSPLVSPFFPYRLQTCILFCTSNRVQTASSSSSFLFPLLFHVQIWSLYFIFTALGELGRVQPSPLVKKGRPAGNAATDMFGSGATGSAAMNGSAGPGPSAQSSLPPLGTPRSAAPSLPSDGFPPLSARESHVQTSTVSKGAPSPTQQVPDLDYFWVLVIHFLFLALFPEFLSLQTYHFPNFVSFRHFSFFNARFTSSPFALIRFYSEMFPTLLSAYFPYNFKLFLQYFVIQSTHSH